MQYRIIIQVIAVGALMSLIGWQSGYAQQSDKESQLKRDKWHQEQKGDARRGFFMFFGAQSGATIPQGLLSDSFANGGLGMISGGLRLHHLRVAVKIGGGRSGGSDLFTESFVELSGYGRESLKAIKTSYSVLLGYDMFISRTLSVGPFVALEWLNVYEESYSFYDPHPNWSLDARSRSQPTVGVEFSFRGSLHNDGRTIGEQRNFLLVNIGAQVSRVRYDNSEYGNGSIIKLYIGLGLENRLFN